MLVKPPIEVTLAEPGDNLPVPFTSWLDKYLKGRKVEAFQQLTWENSEVFVTSRLAMFNLMGRRKKDA